MPEVPLDFPRQWVEFVDPADPAHLIKADLTWLTSRWTCIFGRGCAGIDAEPSGRGLLRARCALLGEEGPQARRQVGRQAHAGSWQRYKVGHKKGWIDEEDGAEKTRVVKGACIFHNDEDFEGGYGCALHHLATAEGVSFIETKPEVCWQLPLRRSYDRRKYEDGTEQLVVVLGEYQRRDWGAGGHDFPWYCTANTEAHIGTEPVFVSNRDEIVALIGQPAYDELARLCRARELLLQQKRFDLGLTPHPADPR